jgi:glycosyltransferase involved in cell wall biosynthesis
MSSDAAGEHPPPRTLAGATVLQIVASLDDDHDGREVLDLTQALVRAGARAVVAGPEGALVTELQSFGGEWIAHPDGRDRFWRIVRMGRHMLEELVATERIDIIHTRGVAAAKFAAKAVDPFGTRLVFGCDERTLAHGRARAFSRALARADRILAHSGYLADLLIAAHGILRERVGQHVVIEAARMLVSGGLRHVVFVLAGDASRQPAYALSLATGARAQGIGRLVRQVGVCADMPAAYAAADFVALPATAPRTFARAAAEALAMGRPVVASELGALPEVVLSPPRAPEAARTGWLVGPADPLALARGLAAAEALEFTALSAVGAHARRLANLLLSPTQVVGAVLAIYAGLIEPGA